MGHATHEPAPQTAEERRGGFPIIPGVTFLLLFICMCSMGGIAVFNEQYRVYLAIGAGLALLGLALSGIWLAFALGWIGRGEPEEPEFSAPAPTVVRRPKSPPAWHPEAPQLFQAIAATVAWAPKLYEKLLATVAEYFQEEVGHSFKTGGDEEGKDSLLDKVIEAANTPAGMTAISQGLEHVGEDHGDSGGRNWGILTPVVAVLSGLGRGVKWALSCGLIALCVLGFGGYFLVNSIFAGPEPTSIPTLVPGSVPTLVGAPSTLSTPTFDPNLLLQPTTVFVPTSGVPSGQITSWQVTCTADQTWCFGGFTGEGQVHLYPWLQAEITAHCTVPGAFEQWKTTHWEDPSGYFYPLRDWYRTNYDKTVNLSGEAGKICADLGGTTK
jgi:hypothetical protein